jgi:hypothetical protein
MNEVNTSKENVWLSFKREPAKMGGNPYDYHFKIPRLYIDNHLVDIDKIYLIQLDNSKIKFKRSPAKLSSVSDLDYCFKIPRLYIENDLVDPNITYTVNFKEINEPEDED